MLEQRMAPGGWTDKWGNHQPPLTKFDLIRDYTAYSKGHFDTPNSDLISSLSFSGLRSGAQAMKSIGSRAYPVLEKALEHTPIVSENFDSPEKSQTLLGEMLKRLGEGRMAILRDERKSGVIPPSPEDKIRVKRKSDGQPGIISRKYFDPAKYEEEKQ
jgi:hypothetical protein